MNTTLRADYFGGFCLRRKREKLKGNPDAFKDLVTDHAKLLQIHEVLSKNLRILARMFLTAKM